RIYLHQAEQDASNYGRALAEAQQGISDPTHDLRTYQSSASSENNMWYQFQVIDRDTYLRMGAQLVDSIMVKRNDPRLPQYFALDGNGLYQGAKPGDAYNPAVQSNLSATRINPEFRQRLVTRAEVQLIIADAAYEPGDLTTALTYRNA